MWTWILIGVILIILLVFFKFKEIRHKFGLVFIAIMLIFFIFSFTQIYKTNGADLKTFDGVMKVVKVYFSWLGNLFKTTGEVTTYAIHQDWGLNSSNLTIPK